MGALAGAGDVWGTDGEDAAAKKVRGASTEPIGDHEVYQLVRVEGDGRLVPATDDEVIEVEHLLEDDENGTISIGHPSHREGCVSTKVLSSNKSDVKGLSQPGSTEINSKKLNAKLEYIEIILQKVKQEESMLLSRESLNSFPVYMDVDGRPSDHLNQSLTGSEGTQSENVSEERAHLISLNGSLSVQSQSVETCLKLYAEPSSVSELSACLKPDLSISKGEICLDILTVTELQEVFKATFGRATTVKDKLWLKRRIAIGLSNSYDPLMAHSVCKVETTNQNRDKEQPLHCLQGSELKASPLSADKELRIGFCSDISLRPTTGNKYRPVLSAKKLRRSVEECDPKNENLLLEQIALKRIRKPTRRYIEELSEVETRDSTGTLSTSDKASGHGQSPPVSRMRSIHSIGSHNRSFITRQDSIGGVHVQIPYISRVRRGRPRKDFMALMNVVGMRCNVSFSPQNVVDMGCDSSCIKPPNGEEELEYRTTYLSGNFSDENVDNLPAHKLTTRRKHHRAWTLSEVMKLVEGVARYGTGRWSEIKRVLFASLDYRTSVDLKDKWRNLLRASFAKGHMDKGVRKLAPAQIPLPILLRVRELADLHSQPGIDFGSSKPAIHRRRAVQGNESGFL